MGYNNKKVLLRKKMLFQDFFVRVVGARRQTDGVDDVPTFMFLCFVLHTKKNEVLTY